MNQALEGLEDLPDAQKQELMQKIEEMQVRDRCNEAFRLLGEACSYIVTSVHVSTKLQCGLPTGLSSRRETAAGFWLLATDLTAMGQPAHV